jgi:hypothetical protein
MEKPQIVTNSDLLTEYWMSKFLEEQRRTNELLEKLVESKSKTTRKKVEKND